MEDRLPWQSQHVAPEHWEFSRSRGGSTRNKRGQAGRSPRALPLPRSGAAGRGLGAELGLGRREKGGLGEGAVQIHPYLPALLPGSFSVGLAVGLLFGLERFCFPEGSVAFACDHGW